MLTNKQELPKPTGQHTVHTKFQRSFRVQSNREFQVLDSTILLSFYEKLQNQPF